MAHSVFGFRTYAASLQSGVARHAAGLVRPENAITRPGWPAVKDLLVDESIPGWPVALDFVNTGWSTGADLGPSDVSPFEPGTDAGDEADPPNRKRKAPAVSRIERTLMAADRVMREELAKPRRGKAPCRAVELLLAGPPPWDSPDAWPLSRVLEWARASVAFVRVALPDAPIAAASLHLDEHSPHLHVTLAPIVREGGKTKLGSRAVRAALAAHAPSRSGRLKGSHRDELSRAAAAYAHHVGQHYGLVAGRVASTAKHVEVDPVEGARRRMETLEQRASGARGEVVELGDRAATLEQRARVAKGEFERVESAKAAAVRSLEQLERDYQTVLGSVDDLEVQREKIRVEAEKLSGEVDKLRELRQLEETTAVATRMAALVAERDAAIAARDAAQEENAEMFSRGEKSGIERIGGMVKTLLVDVGLGPMIEKLPGLADVLTSACAGVTSSAQWRALEEAITKLRPKAARKRAAARGTEHGSEQGSASLPRPDSGFGSGPGL